MTTERRSKLRYPLELNVRYQSLEMTAPTTGAGQTMNISSSGLLVACRADLAQGTRLKLTVEWPSLLNGDTPLQLVTVGTVVRRTESGFAVVFENYQFRTMSRKTTQPSVPLEVSALASVAVGGTGLAAGDGRPTSQQGRGMTRSLSLVPAKS
jgi:hypothetical protein